MALFRIGTKVFKSKKEAQQAVKEIRDKYPDGEYLNEDDMRFVLDLFLEHHPQDPRFDPGIAVVWVEQMQEWGNYPSRGFRFQDMTGKVFAASYLKCFTGWLSTHRAQVRTAMRKEIAHQVIAVKRAQTHLDSAVHVHHLDRGFDQLRKEFLAQQGLVEDDIQLEWPDDYDTTQSTPRLKDRSLASAWQSFHEYHAQLLCMVEEDHKAYHREEAQFSEDFKKHVEWEKAGKVKKQSPDLTAGEF